jgi:hypothetical protein
MSTKHNPNCMCCSNDTQQTCQQRELAQELSLNNHREIYVSLGLHCWIASKIRDDGKRVAAFPFDWVGCFNYKSLINCIKNGLRDFTNVKYLERSPEGCVNNTLYNLGFPHDWTHQKSSDITSDPEHKNVIEKYERRIARFLGLNQYTGHVFFVTTTKPLQHQHSPDTPITLEETQDLNNALRNLFPNLQYTLVAPRTFEELIM